MSNDAHDKTTMTAVIGRGLLGGLGFGVAVGIVHLAIGTALLLAMKMPPMTWFVARSILMEVPLGVLVGLILCPATIPRRGRWIHPLLMTAAFIGLERYVAVDPTELQMWVVPSLVGLGLYGAGALAARRRRGVVVALAVLVPVILLLIPIVKHRATGGYAVEDAGSGATPPPAGAPDVVFIVMDTVRARNVSAYGYHRETTPNFDAFAAEGVLFEDATAPSTWSLPAHASLFTGMFPSVHNGHGETRYLAEERPPLEEGGEPRPMPTLAEAFARAGWETRCFTANTFISPSFGLTRGFGWSDQAWITGAGGRGFSFIYRMVDALGATAKDKGSGQVADNIDRWMEQRPDDAPPAFVFVNFLEAHFPFHQLPPEYRNAYTDAPLRELRLIGQISFGVQFGRQLTSEEYERIHQPIVDMYDGGVRYTDALVGRVIDAWRRRGTYDDTLFVVLADHGELVGEHGAFGHQTPMYEEDLRVPFAIRWPGTIPAGTRVTEPVSTLGTFATIFDLLDLEPPDTLQVGSLLPALEPRDEGSPPVGQPLIAERFEEKLLSARFAPGTANGEGPLLSPWGRYRTYRQGHLKLTRHYEHGEFTTTLFDLESDPGELVDLAQSAAMMAERQRMEEELATWEAFLGLPPLDAEVGAVLEAGAPEISDAAREQLRALGYIE